MSEPAPTPAAPRGARRAVRWTVRLLSAAALARLLLWAFLLPLADFGAGFAGLRVSWRSASLSVLTLSAHVEDLVVRDARDADADRPALLTAHDVFVDVDVPALLAGDLRVVDLGIAGGALSLRRSAAGEWELPGSEPGASAVSLPDRDAPEAAEAAQDLRLPFTIESLRVHGLEVRCVDEARAPAATYRATVDLDVVALGAQDRDNVATLRVGIPGVCDDVRVEARGRAAPREATLDLRADLRGARPERAALPDELLALLDAPHVLDLQVEGNVEIRAPDDAPHEPALSGALTCDLRVDGRERAHLAAALGPTQRAAGGWRASLRADAHLAGLVEHLELRDATLELGAASSSVLGALDVRGLTAGPLRDALGGAGLRLPDGGVDLRGAADVELADSLTLGVSDLEVTTSEGRALRLTQLAIQDLRLLDDEVAVERVEVRGPVLDLRREENGAWTAAGITYAPVERSASEPPADAARPAGALPRLRLGALAWSGADLSFTDAARGADALLRLQAVDVRGDALAFGVDAPPGRLELAFAAPGVAESCRASLSLAPREDGAAVRAEVRARGLDLAALTPWLRPAGVVSVLRDGDLSVAVTADAQLTPAPTLDLELRDLALQDGERSWLGLRRLRASGIQARRDGLQLGEWDVDGLDVLVRPNDAGAYEVAGLRLEPAAARPEPGADAAPEPRDAAATAPLQHGAMTLRGATVRWREAAARAPTRALRIDLEVGAQPSLDAPVDVTAALDLVGSPAALEVDAQLHRTAARFAVEGDLRAAGLNSATLAAVLPQGVACTMEAGALSAGVELDIGLATGGVAGALRDLELRDGEELLAAIANLELDAPQLDATRAHVRTLRLAGARAQVARAGARLLLPGFELQTGRAGALPAEPGPRTATVLQLPAVELGSVQLAVEELRLEDRDAPERPPVRLRGQVTLAEPWSDGPTRAEHAPMRWQVEAAAAPGGARLRADVAASPFAPSPTLDASVELSDLDTTALPLEEAGLRGDASALRLRAALHARLDLRRRDPGRFDLQRALAGELVLEDLELVDVASGVTYAKAASIDVVARAVDLRTGEVLLRSVDVDGPYVATRRDERGLHVAGFVLPDEERAGAPAPADADADAAPAAAPSEPEVAVERLRITGLGYDHRDVTTTPPTSLVLVDTDGELSQFSSDAWSAARPLSFSVAVRGGEIPLPRREAQRSMLSGMLRSGAAMLTGASDEDAPELRPLVDQLTVDGQLVLWPRLQGRVRASVDRLELQAFRGLASGAGVEVTDGLYDARATLEFRGYDGVRVRSDHVFRWLALDEPPNGPLRTYLRLPAPLQTALFLLRDRDGEQHIPLNVEVPRGQQGRAALADALIEGLTKLIGSSLANSGARAASALTGALLGRGPDAPALAETVRFEPGSPLPAALSLEAAAAALDGDPALVVVLHHHLSADDVDHARRLANPPAEVVKQTVAKLEQERDALEVERAPLAADVAALYGAGLVQEAVTRQRALERVETQLGELLEALGGALEQLDGDNRRAAARRTRAAARALAEARLDTISESLHKALPNLGLGRIERRAGRALATAGLGPGGEVVLTLRRRSAQAKGGDELRPQLRR